MVQRSSLSPDAIENVKECCRNVVETVSPFEGLDYNVWRDFAVSCCVARLSKESGRPVDDFSDISEASVVPSEGTWAIEDLPAHTRAKILKLELELMQDSLVEIGKHPSLCSLAFDVARLLKALREI